MRFLVQLRMPHQEDIQVECGKTDEAMQVVRDMQQMSPPTTKITLYDDGKPSVYWRLLPDGWKRTAVRMR